MEKATFAAGCFWGPQHKLARVPGVVSTAVGYEGGAVESPTYQQVCTDRTGHAEVVELDFDPAQVSYEELVRQFFAIHDPTTRHRQGPDLGSQYRSAIFHHSPQQKAVAEKVIAELNAGPFKGAIVTELLPATRFWRAEDYHQHYADKHPGACGID
jgi:peptide-methionine (S)-S-oxide reductase